MQRFQPKSGGLSVLDAAVTRGRSDRTAAQASSDFGPRTAKLGNLQVHRVNTSGEHWMNKKAGKPNEQSRHVHDHYAKWTKTPKGGISAHKQIYHGGEMAMPR